MMQKIRAQSTLEYMAIFAAVVGAIVVLSYTKIKPAIGDLLDGAATKITNAGDDFNTTATTESGVQ